MKSSIFFSSLLLITFLLFGGVANAAEDELPDPGILPGNPFYFLDTVFEGLGTIFTFGDQAKAERFLGLAEERLAEANELAEQGKSNRAEKATEKYTQRLAKALDRAQKAKDKGKDTDAVLTKIAEATVRHQEVLARVYEKVPEQAKEAIAKAMLKSAKGHETALNAVSKEKQKDVREKVKGKSKAVEARLKGLRAKGVPIPDMDIEESDDGNGMEE